MYVIGWAIFGLIVGAIARLLVPGGDRLGCFLTMALGIAGAMVGGFIGRELHVVDRPGFFFSLIGAVLVLAVYRALSRPVV